MKQRLCYLFFNVNKVSIMGCHAGMSRVVLWPSRVGKHEIFFLLAKQIEDEEEDDHKRMLFICPVFWPAYQQVQSWTDIVLKLTSTHVTGSKKLERKKAERMAFPYTVFHISECADWPLVKFLHACSIGIDRTQSAIPIYCLSFPRDDYAFGAQKHSISTVAVRLFKQIGHM